MTGIRQPAFTAILQIQNRKYRYGTSVHLRQVRGSPTRVVSRVDGVFEEHYVFCGVHFPMEKVAALFRRLALGKDREWDSADKGNR